MGCNMQADGWPGYNHTLLRPPYAVEQGAQLLRACYWTSMLWMWACRCGMCCMTQRRKATHRTTKGLP